jgi:signal transduction histidine kinase
MSATTEPLGVEPRRVPGARHDAAGQAGLAGLALVAALAFGLAPGVPHAVPIVLAVAGATAVAGLLAAPAVRALKRDRSLWLLIVLLGLAAGWVLVGLRRADRAWPDYLSIANGRLNPWVQFTYGLNFAPYSGWPWRIGQTALLPLVLAFVAAGGGLVLISDAVRLHLGLSSVRRGPWRVITAAQTRGAQIAWRVVPGIALVLTAAAIGISLANAYTYGDSFKQLWVLLLIGAWAAALIGGPVLIGAWLAIDHDKASRAREEERQRFAAHLHDSVLQTLALVQRQAHDPAAVVRLARRQEHALRAWMAGEAELVSETLASALREVIEGVEDEYAITIELAASVDRPIDARGEALVGAAREALRNAARHGGGAPVVVFCEISAQQVEVFIRDQGPGFDAGAVPPERRGIRDAIIGRLSSAGGAAEIESAPGEGTEVILRLPAGAGR